MIHALQKLRHCSADLGDVAARSAGGSRRIRSSSFNRHVASVCAFAPPILGRTGFFFSFFRELTFVNRAPSRTRVPSDRVYSHGTIKET